MPRFDTDYAIDLMRQAGLDPLDEEVRNYWIETFNAAVEDGLEDPYSVATEVTAGTGEPGFEDLDMITFEAWRLMDDANVQIEDDDPEASTISRESPFQFLKSVEAAITAKSERLGLKVSTGAETIESEAGPPEGESAIKDIVSPSELVKRGLLEGQVPSVKDLPGRMEEPTKDLEDLTPAELILKGLDEPLPGPNE